MASLFARKDSVVSDPPLARWLFNSKIAAWLWLPLRIWFGLQWIQAAEHKITDPAWVQTGLALKGFWLNAVKIPLLLPNPRLLSISTAPSSRCSSTARRIPGLPAGLPMVSC